MEELKSYKPTDRAGHFVAGRRVPWLVTEAAVRDDNGTITTPAVEGPDPDWRVELTERQARYELANGSLVEEETPAPSTSDPALAAPAKAVRVPSSGVTSGGNGTAA